MSAVYANIFASKLKQKGFEVFLYDKYNIVCGYLDKIIFLYASNKKLKFNGNITIPIIPIKFKINNSDKKVILYLENTEHTFNSIGDAVEFIENFCVKNLQCDKLQ